MLPQTTSQGGFGNRPFQKQTPQTKILKVRKNMTISANDISLFINHSSSIKKESRISLLQRLGKKQGPFKVNTTGQLSYKMGNMAINIKKLEISLESGKEPENEHSWRKFFCNLKNLKALTVKTPNLFLLLPFQYLKKLKSIEELRISLHWVCFEENIQWFSHLTSLKSLNLHLDWSHSSNFYLLQENFLYFTKFWKGIFGNKAFYDLDLDFNFGMSHQDFLPLSIFLDYLNSSQVSSFSLRLDIPNAKNALFPMDKLVKTLEKSQLFVLDFYKLTGRKPSRRFAREVYFYGEVGVQLDVETLISECQSLEEITINAALSSSLFPKYLLEPTKMKTLSLTFPILSTQMMSSNLANIGLAISGMSSLEQLMLHNIPLESGNLEQMIQFLEILADKELKSFELGLLGKRYMKTERSLFNNLFIALDAIETLEDLSIQVNQIGDENLLWGLLFPRLKSISIMIQQAQDNLDRSLLFQKLSQIPNLEKLSLDIFSMKGLDEQEVLKRLPDWKNLRELSIRKIAGRSFFERITQDEYKAFIEKGMKISRLGIKTFIEK